MSGSGSRSNRSCGSSGSRRLRSSRLEEQLVKKRQAEYERQLFWDNNSTYFKTWDFNTNFYSSWNNDDSSSANAEKLEKAKKKMENLKERRKKLAELFEGEEKTFAEEMGMKKKKKPILLEDLNAANIEILMREEEARRRERDLKMHLQWKQNQPCLRDFETRQHYDFVKKSWLYQMIEKRKEKEAEEKKMAEHMEELKRMQEEYEEKNRELEEDRKKAEVELKNFLSKQIELIKCKEECEKILRSEETEIVELRNRIEQMIEDKKKAEEKKKRVDLSLFHKRQYQLLLKKRAKEVRENLELDKKLLDKVESDKKYESGLAAERLEQFKRDLKFAREICRKHEEIEKLRESQSQYLFDEEAKQIYEEQEDRWRKESEAREKLLNEVLKTLKSQTEEKLLANLKSQEESRREREFILKTVEKANEELNEHHERAKKSLENFKKDLDQQIIEKQLELYYKKKKQEEDKENELKAKREEEEKLSKELYSMYVTGYKTKSVGKKKSTLWR